MRTFLRETPVLISYKWGEGVNLTAQMLVINQGDKQSFSFKITLKSTSDAVCERTEDTLQPWCDYFSTNCCSLAMLQSWRKERNFRNLSNKCWVQFCMNISSWMYFCFPIWIETLWNICTADLCLKGCFHYTIKAIAMDLRGGWMWKSNVGAITRHVTLKKWVSQKTFKSVHKYRIGNNLVYKHLQTMHNNKLVSCCGSTLVLTNVFMSMACSVGAPPF